MTSRPSAWAPPKRQEDAPPRPAIVEMPPSQPALRPNSQQNLSGGGGSSWSNPNPPQTSVAAAAAAVTVQLSALAIVDTSVPNNKSTQVRCKSSEPLELVVPDLTSSTELPLAAPLRKHSRSFSDPAGALDVVPPPLPPDAVVPTEQSSVSLDATRLSPSVPTIVTPRASGQEDNVECLHDSVATSIGSELANQGEEVPAKEGSESKRQDSKEMSSAVSSLSSVGEQSVPKSTKTVAVITPTPVCVV